MQLQASCKFRKVAAGNGFTLGLSSTHYTSYYIGLRVLNHLIAEGDLWVWGSGQAELGLNRMEETIVPKPARIVVLCPYDEYRHVQFQDISVADRLCFAIAKGMDADSHLAKSNLIPVMLTRQHCLCMG